MGNSSGHETLPKNPETDIKYENKNVHSEQEQQIPENEVDNKNQKLENPGTVEDVHKDCREVLPNFYEGARLNLNKSLSKYFHISHKIKLCPYKAESCYRFGATYVGSKNHKVFESYPVIFGEIEKNGTMQANIVHYLTDSMRLKFGTEFRGNHMIGSQLVADYFGKNFSMSLGIANLNIMKGSGIFVGQYLQTITQNFALGSELGCQYGLLHPVNTITMFNVISRYKKDSSVFSTSIGGSGIHLSYFKEASPQLKIGVEFNTNYDAQSTYSTLGYQIDIPKVDLNFRGSVDTNWNICSVLEKTFKPVPFTFFLSALLNQSTGKFKMGCGLTIG